MRHKAVAAGGAVFSPLDLPNLVGWWDASDEATISDTGGLVDQWDDKSTAGNDATGTTTTRPTTGTTTVNGLNIIDFDGTDDFLTASLATASTDDITMIAVYRLLTNEINETSFFYNGNNSSANGYGLSWDTSTTKFGFLRGGLAWESSTDVTDHTSDVTVIGTLIRDAGQWNASSPDLGFDYAGSTTAPNTPTTGTYFGKNGASDTRELRGGLCEAIICDSALGTTDIADTETYLADKWGITI